ncbi:hypothetical protein ILP97_17510 [Amycolatopsis sp. H6(2020)]|nr:hypothetical protein [Amycolatopsis sp. H6(2020)]
MRVGQASGTLSEGETYVSTLLESDEVAPESLIEFLLPALWLCHPKEAAINRSIDGALVLQEAFSQLGIVTQVKAVSLTVTGPTASQYTEYGTLTPSWSGEQFNGHCVLWIPQSRRIVDVTVEQFPEAAQDQPGPVIGRQVAEIDVHRSRRAAARDQLPAGTEIPVLRRNGVQLLYTVAEAAYCDAATQARAVLDRHAEYHRAGVNLASHALTLLRLPSMATKVQRIHLPRVQALINKIGLREFVTDRKGDFYFTLLVDENYQSCRLDEIPLPDQPADEETSTTEPLIHSFTTSPVEVRKIMKDVDVEARVVLQPTPAMGDWSLPVVLFEPANAVGVQHRDGPVLEAQAEGIISAGFARFDQACDRIPLLSNWSVRRTPTGFELWDRGGIWARAAIDVDDPWLSSAQDHGTVQVIYGVCVGVRTPDGARTYSDLDRDTELANSRNAGIVTVAEIPWRPIQRRSWFDRILRKRSP